MMATQQAPPGAFHYQPSSPLETLVRRTSAKRVNNNISVRTSPSASQEDFHTQYQHHGGQGTPPRGQQQGGYHLSRSPASPLLHSHFARDSMATTASRDADANSYMDTSREYSRESVDSRNIYKEVNYDYEESIYSTDTALRDSWQSSGVGTENGSQRHLSRGASNLASIPTHAYYDEHQSLPSPQGNEYYDTAVPTVVVTSPDYVANSMDRLQLKQTGRAPVVSSPQSTNFSKPMSPSAVPVLMPAEEEKQKVLERNRMRRTPGPPTPSSGHFQYPHSPIGPGDYFTPPPHSYARSQTSQSSYTPSSHYAASPWSQTSFETGVQMPIRGTETGYNQSPSPQTHPDAQYLTSTSHYPSPSSSRPNSPSTSVQQQRAPSPAHSHSSSRSRSHSPSPSPIPRAPDEHYNTPESSPALGPERSRSQRIALPRRPPSFRPDSPVEVYDRYSYYQLDSNTSTPTSASFKMDAAPRSPISPRQEKLKPPPSPQEQQQTQAHHFLQLGIQHHEANQLRESAMYFEKSATQDGGCGPGMLMWGLTLRHGWGCRKDERAAFKWLMKAADNAVVDLESARTGGGIDNGAVRAELILAIYEVGQCFFHGWGVQKDQKMAVSYYRVAARLGDADAQVDLGFCLANGKGCKKDRKEAAKWYRDAVAQGQSDVGLAWIYKEKLQ